MNIKNSTNWSSKDLRKLFRRCVREVDTIEKPSFPFHVRNKNFQLDIKNTHRTSVSGRATVNGYWIMLKIPKRWEELNIDKRQQLAKLMIHEYYHTIGYIYHDKNNYKHDFTRKWDVNFVKDYLIEKKEMIKKTKIDIRQLRYERAVENLRKAKTRLKRAKTIYNKWNIKIKYYEKIFADKQPITRKRGDKL